MTVFEMFFLDLILCWYQYVKEMYAEYGTQYDHKNYL